MTDIHEALDFGYDPSVPENIPLTEPPRPTAAPPSKKTVNAKFLPPVGKQTTPSCFVWASTYGLTTFAAAKANNLDPASTDNQASPIYTYIKVEEQQGNPKRYLCGRQNRLVPRLSENKQGHGVDDRCTLRDRLRRRLDVLG